MAGSPQPQAPQQAAQTGKPRLLCPVMSRSGQQVPCVEHFCALWMARAGLCGLVAHNDRIDDGFERLVRVINDIKAKI